LISLENIQIFVYQVEDIQLIPGNSFINLAWLCLPFAVGMSVLLWPPLAPDWALS
jgi:hypothetical protein